MRSFLITVDFPDAAPLAALLAALRAWLTLHESTETARA